MKDNTSYNSCDANSPLLIVHCLLFLAFLASCTDNDILTDVEADTATTTTEGTLRFTLDQASTRLTYDDLSTTFADGESIGCVLATTTSTTDDDGNTTTSYSFLANSKWTVGKTTDSSGSSTYSLVVSQIYMGSTESDGTVTFTAYDPATDTAYSSSTGTGTLLSTDTNGYLGVNYSDGPVYFFFYYPFVEPSYTTSTTSTTTSADLSSVPYIDTTTGNATTRTYLMGPAYSETIVTTSNTTTTGTDYDGNSVTYTPQTTDAACFTAFPVFVHTNQATATLHNYSDFLWASFTNSGNGVTSEDIGTLGDQKITFAKKTATLRLRSDKQLYNVHIRPWLTSGTSCNIAIGQQIDLTTGTLTAYSGTTTDSSIPQESLYLLPTGSGSDDATYLYPYDNSSAYTSTDDYPYEYRFLLPAQDDFDGTLYFKTSEADTEYTSTALADLYGLSSGNLYNVNYEVTPSDVYCYFESSTYVVKANGSEVDKIVSSVTGSYASITSITVSDGESYDGSYSTALKLESSAGYVWFTLPETMTLKLFFGNYVVSGESTVRARVAIAPVVGGTTGTAVDYYEGVDGVTVTGTDGTQTEGATLSVTLSKGSYVLSKSSISGSQRLLLMVFSYVTSGS